MTSRVPVATPGGRNNNWNDQPARQAVATPGGRNNHWNAQPARQAAGLGMPLRSAQPARQVPGVGMPLNSPLFHSPVRGQRLHHGRVVTPGHRASRTVILQPNAYLPAARPLVGRTSVGHRMGCWEKFLRCLRRIFCCC